jgi:hypothetical protein
VGALTASLGSRDARDLKAAAEETIPSGAKARLVRQLTARLKPRPFKAKARTAAKAETTADSRLRGNEKQKHNDKSNRKSNDKSNGRNNRRSLHSASLRSASVEMTSF